MIEPILIAILFFCVFNTLIWLCLIIGAIVYGPTLIESAKSTVNDTVDDTVNDTVDVYTPDQHSS